MKTTTLTAQFENFVALYTKDKEERVRFFVFFAGAIQLIVFTLLNIVGTIGIYHPFLQTVSFALLALCVAMVTLYLRRTLSLVSAFATFAITAQLLEMTRIAFLLFLTPPGYEAMVIYYQVGSYTILLYLALGFIPQTPLLVTALNIATLRCTTATPSTSKSRYSSHYSAFSLVLWLSLADEASTKYSKKTKIIKTRTTRYSLLST